MPLLRHRFSFVVGLAVCAAPACHENTVNPVPDTPERPVPSRPWPTVTMPPLQASPVPVLEAGLEGSALCAALQRDRTEENAIALNRFALLLSTARIEATVGAPVPDQYGFAAPIDVEQVWFGPTFAAGAHAMLPMDAAQAAAFQPGRYLLGMNGSHPHQDPSSGESRWGALAIIPSTERAPYEDLLGYAVRASDPVAVVEVAEYGAYFATLHVVEPLAGDLPSDIRVTWDAADGLPFPKRGSGRYLATFSQLYYHEGTERYVGYLSDFRPWESEEMVSRALAAPAPGLDLVELLASAAGYRTAWTFRHAPDVVASRISGLSYECCMDARGMYLEHEVDIDFKDSVAPDHIWLGGHDYWSEEQCGDRLLLALDDVDPLSPVPTTGGGAACEPTYTTDSHLPTAEVRVRLPDSAEASQQVERWAQAPEPVYRLTNESEPSAPAALDGNAFWSQPLPLEQLLATAHLSWIRIESVTTLGDVTDVMLETTFYFQDFGPHQRMRLSATCVDPRLLRVGSTWLAPIVSDEPPGSDSTSSEGAFIVPGWLFPLDSLAAAVWGTFDTRLTATRLERASGP